MSENDEQIDKKIKFESEKYDIPDEHLSYSELKDRIREECARVLPKKERILLLAIKLENDLTLKDTICDQICADLGDVTSERHIRRCLPDEYKQHKKRALKESTSQLRTMSENDDKNFREQAVQVTDTGYEGVFENINRPNILSSEELQKLQKRLMDVTEERDRFSNEVKVLKEKSTPELLKELQEKFSVDKPGLLDAKTMQKVSMEAGKNLIILVERYNSIIEEAVEKGQPVPFGTYILTKP